MKLTKKCLPIILSVMLLIAALPGQVFAAANGQNATGYAGETVTATVPFSGVYGVQGTLVLENEAILENVKVSISAPAGYSEVNGKKFIYAPSGEDSVSGSIQVTATIKSSAKPGDTCKITVSEGISTTVDFQDKTWSSSASITVIEKASEGGSGDTDKPGTDKPSTGNKPSSSPNTSATDKNTVDYSELKAQIAIAEGLSKDGYTQAS